MSNVSSLSGIPVIFQMLSITIKIFRACWLMNLCHRVTSNTDKVSSPPKSPHLSLDDFFFPDHVLVKNMIREILVFTASLAAANINCECDCPIPELPKTGDSAVLLLYWIFQLECSSSTMLAIDGSSRNAPFWSSIIVEAKAIIKGRILKFIWSLHWYQ